MTNLLFVFADQMRGMDMGCAGNRDVKTPHLDRLAQTGRLFTQAIATFPVCGPSRASMLTGMTPPHVGVPVNDLALSSNVATLGAIAKANGYRTGYIGKWHLDGLPRDKFTPPGERRFGFDYWAAFNCFHDYFTPRFYRDEPEMIRASGYEPHLQTDLAMEFLKKESSSPFALVVSWGPPHDPYNQVPSRFRQMYDSKNLALRPNVQATSANPMAASLNCRETYAGYYGAISALDDELGRLMDTLEELGLTENTLVVFTSDHGDMLWSHGWMKKQLPFQESIQVPLIVSQPGTIPSGSTSDCLAGSLDLLPTICSLLNWKHDGRFDGEDVSAAFFFGAQRSQPLLIASYVAFGEAAGQDAPEWRGIYTGDRTYVEKTAGAPWLYFDNKADPFQLRNLIDESTAVVSMEKLQGQMTALLQQFGDRFSSGIEFLQDLGLLEEFERLEQALYSPGMVEELKLSRHRAP